MANSTSRKAEVLIDQLEEMVDEASQLIQETAEETIKKQLNVFRDNMQDLSEKLKSYYEDVEEAVVTSAKTTDKVIRNHPYQALAISLAIGVLIGALIRSR